MSPVLDNYDACHFSFLLNTNSWKKSVTLSEINEGRSKAVSD